MSGGFSRSIKTNQLAERRLCFQIDGSDPGLDIGSGLGTLAENSDGNYTITFNRPFARTPIAIATPITDVSTCRIISCTTTAVNVEQVGADLTTPLADADFNLEVIGWDTTTEISVTS